jgi:hypothetical protein
MEEWYQNRQGGEVQARSPGLAAVGGVVAIVRLGWAAVSGAIWQQSWLQ